MIMLAFDPMEPLKHGFTGCQHREAFLNWFPIFRIPKVSCSAEIALDCFGVPVNLCHEGHVEHETPTRLLPMKLITMTHLMSKEGNPKSYLIQQIGSLLTIQLFMIQRP